MIGAHNNQLYTRNNILMCAIAHIGAPHQCTYISLSKPSLAESFSIRTVYSAFAFSRSNGAILTPNTIKRFALLQRLTLHSILGLIYSPQHWPIFSGRSQASCATFAANANAWMQYVSVCIKHFERSRILYVGKWGCALELCVGV